MRIHLPLSLAGFALAFAVVGCERRADIESGAEPSEAEIQEVTERGKAAAQALMQSLGGQLKAALQSGGPVAGIQVCRQAAQPMTAAAGESFEGVTIRRITQKPRNPINAPDPADRAVLEKMLAMASAEAVIEWDDTVARYYQPLMIQEVCLNCHGEPDSFSIELKETLAQLYPDDQATGYALGDFRGAIRVDVER